MDEVWHYTDLIKAHRILMDEEGRFKFYEAYMEARDPNAWLKSPEAPLKEALLLFGWVHSWDPNFEGDLVQFLRIYEEIFPLMKNIEHDTIVKVDFTRDIKDSISVIFDRVAKCCRTPRFESTDASKLLHGILPELFVMWDAAIKKGMKRQGVISSHREQARDYDGRCYAFEFLPKMQEWATKFLDSYVSEKGGDHESACRELRLIADDYTLAKLIDELNYARFTKKIALEQIRGRSLAGTLSGRPTIESDFHNEMLNIYKTAREQCRYNATYFLRLVSEVGGLQAAKRLLSTDAPQYGFTKLWEHGRLDLSVEALVLKREFRSLFTQEELETARKRLRTYGYTSAEP